MIPQMKARGYGADYAVNVTSMSALIANAGVAMRAAKSAGGATYSIFDAMRAIASPPAPGVASRWRTWARAVWPALVRACRAASPSD